MVNTEHGSPNWSVEGWDSKQVAETTQVWRGRVQPCCSHGQTGAALWLTFLSLARRGYSLEAFSIILVQGRLDNYMSIQEAGVQTLEVPEQAV